MRVFYMIRDEDETGISGTGIVAEGVEFEDGTCVIRWQTHGSDHHSTVVWDSLADARAIHGHGGRTWFQFADVIGWPPAAEHNDPAEDDRPHSRACGIRRHAHGPECSPDCPTCLGDGAGPPPLAVVRPPGDDRLGPIGGRVT